MSEKQYTTIQDQVGRTIIGVVSDETDTTITISNPVILHVQPEASGQLQVQSFPVFFFEFLHSDHKTTNDWTYRKSNIVTSNVVLNEQIVSQYEKINTPREEAPKNPKVISIEDL